MSLVLDLTSKQEQFCQNMSLGMFQYKAYKKAYPNFKGNINTAYRLAHELMRNPKIRARIKELQVPILEQLELKQSKLLEWAEKVALGELSKKELKQLRQSNPVVLNNLLNKVLATKSETKNETTVSGIEAILARAKEEKKKAKKSKSKNGKSK